MEADDTIRRILLRIAREIPADADFQVLVSNNARDGEPKWEDATSSLMMGINYLIQNTTADKGFAFNFIITASRGSSGQGGHISSIGGAFE